MKIFLSFCSADKDLVTLMDARFCEAGHQTFSAANIQNGDDVSTAIKQMLAETEAFITIVSKESNNSSWQQFEWRTALELSWNNPALAIIGILIGRLTPPTFLISRPLVRITKDKNPDAIAAEVLTLLTHNDHSMQRSQKKLNNIINKSMSKITSEIDKFRLSEPDLEKEKIWLQKQIDNLSRIDPTNIEIVNLQIKLSDILMSLGNNQEVVEALQKGVDILERSGEVHLLKQAKVQEKLALALEKLGNYEGAINHICRAMNAVGVNFEPRQVQNQLQECQANIPDYVAQLNETLRTATHETATYGRRFLETLQQIDESMNKSKSVTKIGGKQ